ncbi:MAG: hypothetical protein K2M04_02385 [Muribaculaceae bacterium]|nr:hypothetical protein [Muribaculaceae bacterium]
MKLSRGVLISIAVVVMLLTTAVSATAKETFSVAGFRQLPNDVSAFVNPVRDLNDEDCGLIKVIASPEFVFSTPLGIVRRVDKVGEIWLYIPRSSKKITIRHPKWGVLRDYSFPMRIDSHMTYELRIDQPVDPTTTHVDTIISTVRDTLIVTRVDTLVIAPVRPRIPFSTHLLASAAWGGKASGISGGMMLAAMRRHGAFIHLTSDFSSTGHTVGECDRRGYVGNSLPFYSGRTRKSLMLFNVGAIHRLSRRVAVFEGIGYSAASVAWQLASSEGGGWMRNSHLSAKGFSFEAGAMFTYRRLSVGASAISIKGRQWFGSISVGYRIGR